MKLHLLLATGWIVCLALVSKGWAQSATQSYEFVMRAPAEGMFGQPATGSVTASTNYFNYSPTFSLSSVASELSIGGSNPFSWTWNPNVGVDLTALGGPNFSLNQPIGFDLDMSVGFEVGMDMVHVLDTGSFDLQLPMRLDITIDDFSRGTIARIHLDSTFTAAPSLNPSNPHVAHALTATIGTSGSGGMTLYTGNFGSGSQSLEFYDFDASATAELLRSSSTYLSGGIGLVHSGVYEYSQTIDGQVYTGLSNLCWMNTPGLGSSYLDDGLSTCTLRLPGTSGGGAFASEDWYTTAARLDADLLFGLELEMQRPDNVLIQNQASLSTGAMSAATAGTGPYMTIRHNLLNQLRTTYRKKCLLCTTGISSDDPDAGTTPCTPNPCTIYAALDLRNTKDSDVWGLVAQPNGRVSIWDLASAPSDVLGGTSYGMSNWDFWFEYNALDVETVVTLSDEMTAAYAPQLRTRLHFADPVQWRYSPSDSWQTGTVVDMPLEGSFEVQTTCDDYDLAFEPEIYVVPQNDFNQKAKDERALHLELDVLQFNVGMSPIPIIPPFSFSFPCSGSVGEFVNSVASCIASVAAPIANTVCTSPCYLPCVCTHVGGGCDDPCFGILGGCEICWPECGGTGTSACQDCVNALTCFKNSYSCTTCDYGFPGLTIPGFNLAENIGAGPINEYGNRVLGIHKTVPIASATDTYKDVSWHVDGLAPVTTNNLDEPFAFDSTAKAASPFTVANVRVEKVASAPKGRTATLLFETQGGTPPLEVASVDPVANKSYTFPLDGTGRAAVPAGKYEGFVLQDQAGCLGDPAPGVQPLDDILNVPNVQPDVFGYCSDVDEDGCNDCASGSFDPANDGLDSDGDGICNKGDIDDDNDGVLDGDDSDPTNPTICKDSDGDGCDDCASGTFDPANDGLDTDGDGQCDGVIDLDADGDGRENALDDYPLDASQCGDADGDGCDDCSSGAFDLAADGTDTDGDGLCDGGDYDDDNDGRPDGVDSHPLDPYQCADTDGDGCDDCMSGSFDPGNDGDDNDGDGLCDAGDPDDDNDGRIDAEDAAPFDAYQCADTDADGCDDCISGTYNPAADGADLDADGICDEGDDDRDGDGVANDDDWDDSNPLRCEDADEDGCDDCSAAEAVDTDGDGQCNNGDDDDDNDGILDDSDEAPLNAFVCGDFDGDGCDDCSSGSYDPYNDGPDLDSDGICDSGDNDKDGDGLMATGTGLVDSDDTDPYACADFDGDGCEDCLNGTFDPFDDGPNADGDVYCDAGDNCSDLQALNYDDEDNGTCVYLPELAMGATGQITCSSATVNATLLSTGGDPITASGFIWSTSADLSNPDTLPADTDSGALSAVLQGLLNDSTYYVAAFAAHSWGAGVSDTLAVTASHADPCMSPVVFDGHDYAVEPIGCDCWFAENLRTEHYANGDSIPVVLAAADWSATDAGAVAVYNLDAANLTSGRLYNGQAVQDARGLCPSGWNVAAESQWSALVDLLGGESVAGTALKATTWAGTDAADFAALAGGLRAADGAFAELGTTGTWWESAYSGALMRARRMTSAADIARPEYAAGNGFSVRCVRSKAPSVSTVAATDVTTASGTLHGSISDDGGAPVTDFGFIHGAAADLSDGQVATATGDATAFAASLADLSPNATIYFTAFATNAVGTTYGDTLSFTAAFDCTDGTVTYMGHGYTTVAIGEQCWFAENLRTASYTNGDPLQANLTNEQWVNTTDGAFRVADLELFGRLYNGYAVEDERGLCPPDWRVPSVEDWDALANALGGKLIAGEEMKRDTTIVEGIHWTGTNSSGFNALPSGRVLDAGIVFNVGAYSWYWTTTPSVYGGLSARRLYYNQIRFYDTEGHLDVGYSVRCVKE